MHDSRIKRLTRRTVLGAGLFALASWVLKSCKGASAQTNKMTTSSNSDTGKKIVLINPNSNTEATKSMADLARLETEGVARVVERTNRNAPALLTTPQDMIDATPGVVAIGIEAAKDDETVAIIASAFSDPGLEELSEQVDIPVFGIGEEVFHEAAH